MHTWKTDYNVFWGEISDIPIDYEEYKLLSPKEIINKEIHYKIENQDLFLESIYFPNYFDIELFFQFGGDCPIGEWRPELIRNHLCALESQKRVTQMCLESNQIYDYVLYIRPDVEIEAPFPVHQLNTIHQKTLEHLYPIGIPDDNHFSGYNDRSAIVPFSSCEKYGKRIDEIVEFRRNEGRIVSEKYTKYIVDKYFSHIEFLNFPFKIIRPYKEVIQEDSNIE